MDNSPPLTRRGLLQCLGSATLVAGCKTSAISNPVASPSLPEGDDAIEILGPQPTPLSFVLNGTEVTSKVEPRTTLLALLRDHFDQTGSKEGCNRGSCGACTVVVDEIPRNACMILAHDVAGQQVRTVEGLSDSEGLSILQQQFIAKDALQCGFCTSGMLTSCDALLRRHSKARTKLDKHEIKSALSGNLCRCGSYPHIIEAVLETARKKGIA